VSWARLSPRTIQSGAKHRTGAIGKGNPYLKGTLGEVAAAPAKTNTFLGQRYRRLVRRIGKLKALVAVARSILVIVWHLLADPTARFHDLGADYYTNRIDKDRKTRSHIRQLQALGYSVTLPQPPDQHRPTPRPQTPRPGRPLPTLARRSFSSQPVISIGWNWTPPPDCWTR
jgi:transposase